MRPTLAGRVPRGCLVLSLALTVLSGLLRGSTQAGPEKAGEEIALLEDLYDKQPDAPGLDAKLGKAYYQKRDFARAIPILKRALIASPESAEIAQLLALSYVSTGRMNLAIPLLEGVQRQGGGAEFDASYLLGVCYLKNQEYEKARTAFARMYSVTAESATGHLLFARMMVRENLEDKAIPELKRAINLDPRLPMVHFLLGEIYLHQSESKLALEEFRKELEISPTVWLVYWRLGDAFARLENYPEAEKALKQAIWLNETFSGPYVLLGQIQLKKGDLELAIGFLDRAAQMDPNNYHAHYFLGQAYQKAGLSDKALREFDLARALLTRKNAQLIPFSQDTQLQ